MNTITYKLGDKVMFQGRRYTIYRYLSLLLVMGQEEETSNLETLKISELSACLDNKPKNTKEPAIDLSNEADWQLAKERFEIIKPILSKKGDGKLVQEIAESSGYGLTTIYRWLRSYEASNLLSSLLPEANEGGKGKSRLSSEIDLIIQSVIEDFYLTKQRNSVQKVFREVLIRCKNAGETPPHSNTIRNRISQINDYKRILGRYGKKMADEAYSPKPDSFPELHQPLSTVQIDHTKMDIIVVDETYRKPIGRPWITMAIDVYSRMVLGFHISLDPPGAMGTGLCICHAIQPKEQWLAKLDVAGEWPCWGIMQVIHVDNAKEFKGAMLKRACEEYNIQVEWRPVATPHYGGHIERLLGTFMKELHSLPGTTFSNPKERKGYESEKNAVFTLSEIEKWLTTFIINVYHKKIHRSLKTTPFAKFSDGIFGSNETAGIGIPPRILNEQKLRLDFMPFVERTVQEYGVVVDNIHYYHEVLRRWINASEPGSGKNRVKTKFIFKRDPRDISTLYFYDPELKEYYVIPYRNISRPPMSIWEFNEIVNRLKEQGKSEYNEEMIFEAYEKLKEIENQAIQRTIQNKKTSSKLLRKSESRAKLAQKQEPTPETIYFNGPVNLGTNITAYEDLDF